jgi:HAD superfamily hydrolase (TIGR01490 family)
MSKYKTRRRGYKAAAFFDVDGTLVRGILIRDFARYLRIQNLISPETERDIRKIIHLYERSIPNTNKDEEKERFERFASDLLTRYCESLSGRSTYQLKVESGKFIDRIYVNRFPYTRTLINAVKERGYEPIVVSACTSELISVFAGRLDIQKSFSTEYEEKEGRITGKISKSAAKAGSKKSIVSQFCRENGFDQKSCAGFGDSMLDEEFLRYVGHRFAVNPSYRLREIAEKEGWHIADEDKSVIHIVKRELPNLRD